MSPPQFATFAAVSNADISILAVENDPLQARILRHQLHELGYVLAGVAGAAEAAEVLFAELQPDLVLLDIHLDGSRDGISTAEALLRHRRVPLIFITAFPDAPTFARARQVGPFAFLRKPYDGLLLGHSIELALQHFALAQGQVPNADNGDLSDGAVLLNSVFVRQQQRFVKVPLAHLLVLEADGGYTHLFTANRKFTIRQGLADLLLALPAGQFCQIHRSHAVQVAAIEALDPSTGTVLVSGHTLHIGRSYREALTARLKLLK